MLKINGKTQKNAATVNDFTTLVSRLAKMSAPASKHVALLEVLKSAVQPESTFEIHDDDGKTEFTGTFANLYQIVDAWGKAGNMVEVSTKIEALRTEINTLKVGYESMIATITPIVGEAKEKKVTVKPVKVYTLD